jgi:hypothetical protein
MFLVDTCGWIEWMTDTPLAKSYSRYLTSPDTLIVPTLVQHELFDILPHLDDETVATLRRKGRGFLLRSGVALSLP